MSHAYDQLDPRGQAFHLTVADDELEREGPVGPRRKPRDRPIGVLQRHGRTPDLGPAIGELLIAVRIVRGDAVQSHNLGQLWRGGAIGDLRDRSEIAGVLRRADINPAVYDPGASVGIQGRDVR